MSDKEGSSLENLSKRLYGQAGEPEGQPKRHGLSEQDIDIQHEWPASQKVEEVMARPKHRKRLRPKTVLIAALSFFVISLAVSAFFLFSDKSAVSARNIDIEVEGPTVVSGGDELSLQITITNRNAVALQNADLLIEYPEGTRTSANVDVELPRYREELGVIKPGERVNRTVRAVFFGEAESIKEIQVSLEYRVENSNAIFYKDVPYEIKLASTPLTLTIEGLDETVSGQEITLVAVVASNSDKVVKNAVLEIEYPFGFEFKESDPEPSFPNTVWRLADIPPGGKRVVTIRGILTGQDNEERIFQFRTGIASSDNENRLSTVLSTVPYRMLINRPFIDVNVAVNGKQESVAVVRAGEKIRADITWRNNLQTKITDAKITAKLSGAFDESSMSVTRGFYRSQDNTIIWASDQIAELSALSPGDAGQVSFSFVPDSKTSGIKNPVIQIEISISGRRLSDTRVPEEVRSTITQSIHVATDLSLSARAVHFVGPFVNAGPIPPIAEKKTTYTIIWTVANSSNDVSDAVVTATLPSYVEWLGTVEPSGEDIVYRSVGGEIVWKLGDVPSGIGYKRASREVAFQVSITPSLSQIGEKPILINNQRVEGTDLFTQVRASDTASALSTELTTDPNFIRNQGEVAR